MKIWAHCLVKNEDKFLWFAVESIIDQIDKILIWDTGSSDKTNEIIEFLSNKYSEKISYKKIGKISKQEYPRVRQKMLEETSADWIMILDGDEVWWKESLESVITKIKDSPGISGIAVCFYMCVGDICHYQDESAGKYNIKGRKGHLSLRFINRNIPGLHVKLPYGSEGYFDETGKAVQDRDDIYLSDAKYLHLSHLSRSTNKDYSPKIKYEVGRTFPKNFKYPEVFYQELPALVSSPWNRMSIGFYIISQLLMPLRVLKRGVDNFFYKV